MRPDFLKQYTNYISNVGGVVTKAQFDEDWEPIGPMLRANLIENQMINYMNDEITVDGSV